MQKKKPSAKQLAARAKFTKMVKARAAKSKAAKNKKLGALPVGFSGSVYGVNFKVINQYSIYNDVSAIVEDKKNGNTIVVFDGIGNAVSKADTMASYIIKNTTSFFNDTDKKQLKSRLLKFCANMQMEVKNFNAGKKKTIKKRPLVITKPIKLIKKAATKKQANKKINKQTGTSNRAIDIKLQAKKPGKRTSKKGNIYYESRENRSDKGKLLGINNNVVGKFFALEEYKKKLAAINNFNSIIIKIKTSLPTIKTKHTKEALKKELLYVKKMLLEYKTHARELKKLV